jgi:hypothetical protein
VCVCEWAYFWQVCLYAGVCAFVSGGTSGRCVCVFVLVSGRTSGRCVCMPVCVRL